CLFFCHSLLYFLHDHFVVVFLSFFFFFFFQAEDGIRDGHVTGVQTCALPILWERSPVLSVALVGPLLAISLYQRSTHRALRAMRSEERRVGKECRSRWSADH